MKSSQIFSLLLQYFVFDNKSKNLFFFSCYNVQENYGFMLKTSMKGIPLKIIQLNKATGISESVNNLLTWSDEMSSLGVILDYNCYGSHKLIEMSALNLCFSKKFQWLIYEDNADLNNSFLIKQLKKTKLFVDADISYISFDSTNASTLNDNGVTRYAYPIYDIYNNGYTHGGKLNITFDRYFTYNYKSGNGSLTESILRRKNKYDNRNNLNDIILRVGFIVQAKPITLPPKVLWNYVLTDQNITTDNIAKSTSNILINLFQILQCNISPRPFSKWTTNDSYGAALQAMHENEIDLISSSLVFLIPRLRYISLVSQIQPFQSMIYFRTPRTVDPLSRDFFKPFGTSVWICLMVVMLVVSIAMKFMSMWEQKLTQIKRNDSFFLLFGVASGAFCQQGTSLTPNLTSGRCVYIFLFLSSIVIYNYYTSILVSTLVGSPLKTKIKTVEDIADSELKVGFEDTPYMKSFVNNPDQEDIIYLFKKKLDVSDGSTFQQAQKGFRLVQRGGYAFHSEGSTANPIIRETFDINQICDLNEIRFRKNKYIGFATRKRDPFKELYGIRYFWLRETGIVSKHKRQWLTSKPSCSTNAIVASASLESTAAVFVYLAMAYALSLFILLCEIILSIYQRRLKRDR